MTDYVTLGHAALGWLYGDPATFLSFFGSVFEGGVVLPKCSRIFAAIAP